MDNYKMSLKIAGQGNYQDPCREQELRRWILLVPLTDAQLTKQRPLDRIQGLAWNRIQVIESAFYVASHLSQSIGRSGSPLNVGGYGEEQPEIPSIEFLSWMLNDLGGDRFGSFVLDYFKHVSRPTLKHMGLSLLRKTASPHDTLLYTVCVNSMAYKFINCLLMNEDDGQLSQMLRERAAKYKRTAQNALRRIPLLTSPSLALLQATLCGGSGETQLCCDLTRVACRVCVDLRLHAAANSQGVTEEEYFCVMWCYMLDRNYAWKLGRFDCFLSVVPGIDDTPVSELFSIYMELAHVQSVLIPFLNDESFSERETAGQSFSHVRVQLFLTMDRIRRKIDRVSPPSPQWKGLDVRCEVAALDFGFHSIMTTILHLTQVKSGEIHGAGELYLQSARQELSALFAHPTSLASLTHPQDFAVLSSDRLLRPILQRRRDIPSSGTVSQPIATLQRLFHEFVLLSQTFISGPGSMAPVDDGVLEKRSNLTQEPTSPCSSLSLYGIDSAPGQETTLSGADDYFYGSSSSVFDQMLSPGELAFLNGSHSEGNLASETIDMSTPDVVTGSCLCQKVRYKVTGAPLTTIICHCDSCRKSTGSAFMANSFYLKTQLQVLAGEEVLRVYHDRGTGSGKPLSRSFCSNCGSPLFISSESIDPAAVTVTSGTMDLRPARSEWAPAMEVFCARRREWLAPVEGTEKHDTMIRNATIKDRVRLGPGNGYMDIESWGTGTGHRRGCDIAPHLTAERNSCLQRNQPFKVPLAKSTECEETRSREIREGGKSSPGRNFLEPKGRTKDDLGLSSDGPVQLEIIISKEITGG
ncbi:hypothetical protein LV157_004782 [Aspergillus fumigatus]|nr:hypothetical protein LV157_004782 [Aspergillus fumigatus]